MDNRIDEIYLRIEKGRAIILGLGISNRPLVDFLQKSGAKNIAVYDKKTYDELLPYSEQLLKMGVDLHLGVDFLSDLYRAQDAEHTVVFRSPGFREDLPEIADIIRRGAILYSEMEMFIDLTSATVVGITGSDGKTTTTTLIYKMLEKQTEAQKVGKVYVGGNIGEPLLPYVHNMKKEDFAVVELSSFQLQTMKRSPVISVITNITPNHLNWHVDMNEYATAKKNIYIHEPNRAVILNAENEYTASYALDCGRAVTLFSSKRTGYANIVPNGLKNATAIYIKNGKITYCDGETETFVINISDIRLPGMHNVENCMCAIGALWGIVELQYMREIATTFGGVEHRLEYVDKVNGIEYYNSSIDSSPTRTAAALSAFCKKPLIICGGYDKHIPFEPLALTLCERAKIVVLTGATMQKIRDAIEACPEYANSELYVIEEKDFNKAFEKINEFAKEGDIVLLSPACASFDAFSNFEERGKCFKDLVYKLKDKTVIH